MSHVGPQERLERIVELARQLTNGDESVRENLKHEIEVHDAIEQHLDEVFEKWNTSARSSFIVDQRTPTAFTRPNP